MTPPAMSEADLANLQNDIAALKKDIASLLAHLREGATNSAQSGAEQINEGARRLYRNVAARTGEPLEAIEARIEERPLAAVLVAGVVGFIAGRLLSR